MTCKDQIIIIFIVIQVTIEYPYEEIALKTENSHKLQKITKIIIFIITVFFRKTRLPSP